MLASIDIDTGKIQRIVRGVGPEQETLFQHPENGAQVEGFQIPEWNRITELCRRAGDAIPGLPPQAWDIALCPSGPVLVETNIGGDINLPQIASGNGIMDPRLTAFLDA